MTENDYPSWESWFYYDETSPSYLRWKLDRHSGRSGKGRKIVSAGDIAGCLTDCGYYYVGLKGKLYPSHRIIYELLTGEKLGDCQVDHIDGVRGNNNIENLRKVNRTQNARNLSLRKQNRSGKLGVCYLVDYKKQIAKSYPRWVASWCGIDGVQRAKSFSVDKYGFDEAFRLACNYRDKMIAELNSQGAGYTDRHGKVKVSVT